MFKQRGGKCSRRMKLLVCDGYQLQSKKLIDIVGMIFGDESSEAMIDKYMLLIYGRDAQADLSVVVTGKI